MRFAYADPPYIGCADLYPEKQEVDHNELIKRMCAEFDGWALSCSSPSLKTILGYPTCPDDVRIGSWVKPFASFKPNVNPAFAWEPVIFWHGRNLGRDVPTVRDWISENITLEKGMIGAKPPKFCYWLFEFLGMKPEDEFYDLFPGTGIVMQCWQSWRNNNKESLMNLPLFGEI